MPDAKIYLWQVGADGKYPYVPLRTRIDKTMLNLMSQSSFTGSGTATTNNKGEFYFITLYPGKMHSKGAKVNIRVEHRDLGQLQTKLYLTSRNINSENFGEISHALSDLPNELTIYEFNVVMSGKTTRRY